MNGVDSDLQNCSISKKQRLTNMPVAKPKDCCHLSWTCCSMTSLIAPPIT